MRCMHACHIVRRLELLARDDEAARADLEAADLSWTEPYLAKGIAEAEAGRTISADALHAELRDRVRVGRD